MSDQNIQLFLKRYSSKADAIKAIRFVIDTLEELYLNLDTNVVQKHAEMMHLIGELEGFSDRDLAQEVMDFFNEVNGTHFIQKAKIDGLIRQIPKISFEQFRSVILHKHETWGSDEKMKQYIRPATLFGSKQKFLTYLDDATNYWIKKARAQGQVQQAGRTA